MSIRVGIVGTGFARVHVEALKKIPGTEVCAITSRKKERAKEFSKANGIKAEAFDCFKEMLDSAKPDAVYVCLPPFAHEGEVEMAADRGIHLLVEKPIAINSRKARKMVDAIESNRVKSQVGFHMMFRKSVRSLKKMIDNSDAGRPTLFTGRFWANMECSEWWRDKKRSGGQVFEQVIHTYDLATYLFGKVEKADGILRNICHKGRKDYTIEDTSIGALQFTNGAVGVITGSNCAVPNHYFGDFRAVCEKVTLDYKSTGQSWIEPDKALLYLGSKKEEIAEDEDPYLLENKDFIDAIRKNKETVTPARAGLETILIVESVIKNIIKGN